MDENEYLLLPYINLMFAKNNRLATPINLGKFYVKDFPTLSSPVFVHNSGTITKFKPSISIFTYDPNNIVHWALRFELLKNCDLLPMGLEGNPEKIKQQYQRLIETESPLDAVNLFMRSRAGFIESKKYVICVASSFSHRTLDTIRLNGPTPHHELHAMIEFTTHNNVTINRIIIRKRQTPILDDIFSHQEGKSYFHYTPVPKNPDYYKLHSFAYNYSFKFLIIYFYQVVRQLFFWKSPTTLTQQNNNNRLHVGINNSIEYVDLWIDNLELFKTISKHAEILRNLNLSPISWEGKYLNNNNEYVTNTHYLVSINSEPSNVHELLRVLFGFYEFSGKNIKNLISNLISLNDEIYNEIGGNFIVDGIIIGVDNPINMPVISQKSISPYTPEQFVKEVVKEIDSFINLVNIPFELYNNEKDYNAVLFKIFFEHVDSLSEGVDLSDLFLTNNIVSYWSTNFKGDEDTWFHLLSIEDMISAYMEQITLYQFNLSWKNSNKKCESKFVILYGRGNQISKTKYTADINTGGDEEIGKYLLRTFYENVIKDADSAINTIDDNVNRRLLYFDYEDIEQSYHLSVYDTTKKQIVAIALFDLYEASSNMNHIKNMKTGLFRNNNKFFNTKKVFYLNVLYTLSEYSVDGMKQLEKNPNKNKIYNIDSSKKTKYSVSLASILVWCTLNLAQGLAEMFIPIVGYGVVTSSSRSTKILERFRIEKAKIYNIGKNKKLDVVFGEISKLLTNFYQNYLPPPLAGEYTHIQNNYIENDKLEKIRLFRLKVNNFVENLRGGDENVTKKIKLEYAQIMDKYYGAIVKRYEYQEILMKLGGNLSYSTFPDFRFLNFTNKNDMSYNREIIKKVGIEFKENCGLIYQHLTLEKRPRSSEYEEEPLKQVLKTED
jgi:hypothetical protein